MQTFPAFLEHTYFYTSRVIEHNLSLSILNKKTKNVEWLPSKKGCGE